MSNSIAQSITYLVNNATTTVFAIGGAGQIPPGTSSITVVSGSNDDVALNALVASGNYAVTIVSSVSASTSTINPTLTPVQLQAFNQGNILTSSGGVYALSGVDAPQSAITVSGLIFTGAGEFGGYNSSAASGNITVYDNTSAGGLIIYGPQAVVAGSNQLARKLIFNTGCYIVLTGSLSLVPYL